MNSSQRRKLKREYPYYIKLVAKPAEAYFKHDDRVEDAREWCNKNTKGYTTNKSWDHTIFKFIKEKDAVFFALKWL
jgi:hypothetical protein